MSNHIKLAMAISATLTLSACLEVEDNKNNDAVVAALEAQNQLLQDQNNASAKPITLSGTLIGATEGVALSDAQVSIKFAEGWSTPVSITDSKLFLDKQPANSDFMLKVESPSGSFVTMAYKGMTKGGAQGQLVSQDLGEITLGKPKEKLLTLLHSGENTYVEGLDLYPVYVVDDYPNYYMSYPLKLQQPEFTADFTKEIGEYKLILPEGIPTEIHANLDIDSDGINDFELELGQNGSTSKLLSSSKIWAEGLLYLKEVNQLKEYSLRLTLLNGEGEALGGARVSSANNDHGNAYFEYDSTSGQYVLDVAYRGALNVEIPSFKVGTLNYTSAEVSINQTEFEQQYNVYISDSQYHSFLTEVVAGELNLVVNLSTFSYQSPSIKVLSKTTRNTDFEIFYSAPVALVEEEDIQTSVMLVATDSVKVIPGNIQNEEGVSPGTTYLMSEHKIIGTDVALSLNGTKLTASPVDELIDGEYQYRVGELVNVIASNEEDVYNDDSNPLYVYNISFNINDVVLDNRNFTTNGSLIVSKNTADETVICGWCGASNSVSLYFPTSINNLHELTLTMTSYKEHGVSNDYHNEIKVVVAGELYSTSKQYLLKAAQNENINSSSIYPQTGTSLESGYRYSNYTYLHLEDDVVNNENSATFDYSYTTKEGVHQTGTMTYKVK
ncbi:hypothetical protein Sps_00331 [Shewanella psychrophila]|uniref:Uncharacterized protein n=1 Tax=Shewanella psychrophila TaxID=225848 RepID=A0A1S6HJ58_9GAMM|nr:hypothetical protein [Shewanella psychrophila]AQS35551.1 hypothetical protein Sps_00331 [Shewanella psychrophila]